MYCYLSFFVVVTFFLDDWTCIAAVCLCSMYSQAENTLASA
jgi:hypothetical protein